MKTARTDIKMTGDTIELSIDGKRILHWHADEWIEDHNLVFIIADACAWATRDPIGFLSHLSPLCQETEEICDCGRKLNTKEERSCYECIWCGYLSHKV